MPQEIPNEFYEGAHARRDWVDLRDQPYAPSLSILRDSVSLDPRLLHKLPDRDLRAPLFGVRDQMHTQRCVGYALAALIDIQRSLQWLRQPDGETVLKKKMPQIRQDIASADMLYRMAFFHDSYPDLDKDQGPEGIRSLRSAIKGFYHHGACLDWPESARCGDAGRWQSTSFWPDTPDNRNLLPTVAQSKRAREIGLGAYFRLASVLNHYHSALNDAAAILTTANIHDGWSEAVPEQGGLITWPPKLGKTGSHAVVLVGYDAEGFHVLNSWGADWGGYKGQAGIALWRYADWATNVIDSWVLRLGVSAPKAFGFSVGEKGVKGRHGPVQSGTTPCFELVGHYMHLDDGFHVSTGSYPSFPSGWKKTCAYLEGALSRDQPAALPEAKHYSGMLVWIPGSLEGIKPAFADAVARKQRIKALGLYPYNLFWCNSFVEKSLELLELIFENCKAQAGAEAEHLDALIESSTQGVGRAFWREIEMSARRAVWGTGELPNEAEERDDPKRIDPGYVAEFLQHLIARKAEVGCGLHLVAEGAGALVVDEMLAFGARRLGMDMSGVFDTIHLVHPAIGLPRAEYRLIPLLQTMNAATLPIKPDQAPETDAVVQAVGPDGAATRARVYVPTPELEARLRFGDYGKSLLHLVSRSFEDLSLSPDPGGAGAHTPAGPCAQANDDAPRRGAPRTFLGMAKIAEDETFPARSSIFQLRDVAGSGRAGALVSQSELTRDPHISNEIFKLIRAMCPSTETF